MPIAIHYKGPSQQVSNDSFFRSWPGSCHSSGVPILPRDFIDAVASTISKIQCFPGIAAYRNSGLLSTYSSYIAANIEVGHHLPACGLHWSRRHAKLYLKKNENGKAAKPLSLTATSCFDTMKMRSVGTFCLALDTAERPEV